MTNDPVAEEIANRASRLIDEFRRRNHFGQLYETDAWNRYQRAHNMARESQNIDQFEMHDRHANEIWEGMSAPFLDELSSYEERFEECARQAEERLKQMTADGGELSTDHETHQRFRFAQSVVNVIRNTPRQFDYSNVRDILTKTKHDDEMLRNSTKMLLQAQAISPARPNAMDEEPISDSTDDLELRKLELQLEMQRAQQEHERNMALINRDIKLAELQTTQNAVAAQQDTGATLDALIREITKDGTAQDN